MFKNKIMKLSLTNTLSSAIDITASIVKNDIDKLINVSMLTSIVKTCENNFGSIFKLLSMIITVSLSVKFSRHVSKFKFKFYIFTFEFSYLTAVTTGLSK